MSIFSDNCNQYLTKGYSVIPLDPGTKKPAIKNWSNYCVSQATADEIKNWSTDFSGAGIGVANGHGAGIESIDIDLNLDDPVDCDIYEKIKIYIPESPVQKVGKKGFTVFYRYSGNQTTRIKLGGRVVVEILAQGTFTVLPPSTHPDTGQPYTWISNKTLYELSPNQLPYLPKENIDKIREIIGRITAPWDLNTAGGRNDNLKQQVIAAIYRGKSNEEIESEILAYDRNNHNPELFCDANDPQMRDRNSEENASRFVASIRASLKKENESLVVDGLSFISWSTLLARKEVAVPWLTEGLLPLGGTSILAAKPKCGKSTLSRQLAVCVARGEPFLGRNTIQGRVLYIALEEKCSEVKRHLCDLGAEDDCDIHITTDGPGKNGISQLKRAVEKYSPALVIIDPIFRFEKIPDGNNYSAVTAALEPYCVLARSSGAHIMMIHHRGKGEKSGGDSFLGSTAIFAAVDTALTMNRSERHRTIKSEQRYGVDLEESVLLYNEARRSMSLTGTKIAADSDAAGTRILDYLRSTQSALTEDQVIKHIGGSTKIARRALRSAIESGKISRVGTGRKGSPYLYSVTPESVESFK